jgi:glycosyltransferase involved in cell wall biosynthesis
VKISVALCTHNGARFIEEQVASILLQTVPTHHATTP